MVKRNEDLVFFTIFALWIIGSVIEIIFSGINIIANLSLAIVMIIYSCLKYAFPNFSHWLHKRIKK